MGVTIVMVTHNQELARRSDRMLEMKDGQISPIDPLTDVAVTSAAGPG